MKLFYRAYGSGSPLIILHGLFGMSDNWIEIAKSFSDSFKVYLPDLRNHGNSPHADLQSYGAMSQDLIEFLDDLNIKESCFIGHSMGGKVLLNFANMYPEAVKKMVIVDISPRKYPHEEVEHSIKVGHQQIISVLSKINERKYKNRNELLQFIDTGIQDAFTKQIIYKNLKKNVEHIYESKINIEAIISNYDLIRGEIVLGENIRYTDSLFIFGSESPYYEKTDELFIREKMPYSQIRIIKDAGHLVHHEKRDDFLKLAKQFFEC